MRSATLTNKRCSWASLDGPMLLQYHDREWGVPVHNERKHFEVLVLSGAQAGLSWSLVLKKREGYRRAFDKFDPEKVAHYSDRQIQKLATDPAIIRDWCHHIDLGRNLPLLAMIDGKIVGDATLHQQLGGWKRHIGRVSVLVLPQYRGRGLARALISEMADIARHLGLERVEAEFIGGQEAAIKMFALLGFSNLLRLEDYVKDMQGIKHDYVLMGLNLKTDEEYAGME